MKTKTTKYVVQFQDEKGVFQDDLEYRRRGDANDHYDALKAVDPSARILKRTVTIDEVIVS